MGIVNSISTEIKLDERNWTEALDLIKKLIQCHPVYASQGLNEAQNLVYSHMKQNQWDEIYDISYSDDEIKLFPDYVHVKSFGPIYANYDKVPKRTIIGIVNGYETGPTLILNGHIDVDFVSTPHLWKEKNGWLSAKVEDHKITGRGATDMLSGLVSLLIITTILHQNRHLWRGKVIFTSVVDEEIGGNGTLHALEWLKSKGLLEGQSECLIAEPTNSKVCRWSLGFMHLIATFKRRSVHMGVAKKHNSCLWDMQHFIENFESILFEAASLLDPNVNPHTLIFNFGIVQGGIDSAIPLAELIIEGTIFFPESINAKALFQSIKTLVQSKSLPVSLSMGDFVFKGADFQSSKLSKTLENNLYYEGIFPSPCDARLLKSYAIPTVIFGPGKLEEAHAIDEFIHINDIKAYIDHVLKYIPNYFGQ